MTPALLIIGGVHIVVANLHVYIIHAKQTKNELPNVQCWANAGPMLGPQLVTSWLYQPTHVPLTPRNLAIASPNTLQWTNVATTFQWKLGTIATLILRIKVPVCSHLGCYVSYISPSYFPIIFRGSSPTIKRNLWIRRTSPIHPKLIENHSLSNTSNSSNLHLN